MQFIIIRKKGLRILSAILIAALVLTLGMIAPPASGQPGSQAHALANDSLLTVTLTGAKVSPYQEYFEFGEEYYIPGYGSLHVTPGAIYNGLLAAGQPDPYPSYAYDLAELLVYNDMTEEWTTVASDSLYDSVAADAAVRVAYNNMQIAAQSAGYASASYYAYRDAFWAASRARYEKATFDFRFDSKWIGKYATIRYVNAAKTREDYGDVPSQILGGYFGDVYDYDDYATNIRTFSLTPGVAAYDLEKAVYQTLNVTPIDTPLNANDDVITTAPAWIDTEGEAYRIIENAGEAADYARIISLNSFTRRYDPAAGRYVYSYLFSNPLTGVYVFPALEGQKLLFRGAGSYNDGTTYSDGSPRGSRSFQTQWLGGYKALNIVGNPKTVKKVSVTSKDATVGTIRLTKGTARITGLVPADNTSAIEAYGIGKDQAFRSGVAWRDRVPSNYDEWARFADGGTEVRVDRVEPVGFVPTRVTAYEQEYVAYLSSYNVRTGYHVYPDVVEIDRSQYVTNAAVATKAEYDALPPELQAGLDYRTGQYLKRVYSYTKYTVPYTYWRYSTTYEIDNLQAGVYYLQFGGLVRVVEVKNGRTVRANFKTPLKNPGSPTYLTEITGAKAKGNKLTASTRVQSPGFGQGETTYRYFWTDGAKIVKKSAALRITKSYLRKNLWVISIATYRNYQTVANGWTAAPGNAYGDIGFDVTVTGDFKKGERVKAIVENAQVTGVKYAYQWLRNGKAIKKATKATYKLTKEDKGKKISVKVTGEKIGYATKSIKSRATKSK